MWLYSITLFYFHLSDISLVANEYKFCNYIILDFTFLSFTRIFTATIELHNTLKFPSFEIFTSVF